jgi:hypothetical protein
VFDRTITLIRLRGAYRTKHLSVQSRFAQLSPRQHNRPDNSFEWSLATPGGNSLTIWWKGAENWINSVQLELVCLFQQKHLLRVSEMSVYIRAFSTLWVLFLVRLMGYVTYQVVRLITYQISGYTPYGVL